LYLNHDATEPYGDRAGVGGDREADGRRDAPGRGP
jgi:hypothetical protein